MRHEDIDIGGCLVHVVPRHNANGMRAKGGRGRAVPAGAPLMRLYADYLNREYGAVDSDYVLSGCRDNTYCPEPGVIPRTSASSLIMSVAGFQRSR